MSGFIPEHKIDEIRNAADIVEVISIYVNLKRSSGRYWGLCPFHAEKTPSFTVNPEKRIFRCFGCGAGGNVFQFLMRHKGVSFPEAVLELAERYGIEVPRVEPPRGRAKESTKAALYQAVDLARRFFEEELWAESGRKAREYLSGRGLGEDLIREFHLGWAPDAWDHLRLFLDSKGLSAEVMQTAGLVKARGDGRGYYDTFRGRVICPIFDLDGKTVAFGGRILAEDDRQPKYLNSPETPIFHKGRILYGLERARSFLKKERAVLIVEGYFDLLALAAQGIGHVVATLGTALTSAHIRLLKGYVEQVFLVFDADEAGRTAAARALPLFFSADMDARVLRLPEGHDPDTFVRAYGAAALSQALEGASLLLDFYLDQTKARYPDSLTGKSQAVQDVLSVISAVETQARQDLLRKAAAERLGVSEEALRLSERRSSRSDLNMDLPIDELAVDVETEALRLIILHPEIRPRVFAAGLDAHFTGARARRIFEAMRRQFQQTGQIDLDRLLEVLEDDQVRLVTALAFSEDGLDGEELASAVEDFINRFFSRSFRRRSAELSRRIKQAQEAADYASLDILLEEKNRLLKENTLGETKGRIR